MVSARWSSLKMKRMLGLSAASLLSFPVAYGLALQGLAKGAVHTNLLPREITYDRLVKKYYPTVGYHFPDFFQKK